MDFITRQFIVLAKKLRKEFIVSRETLHNDLSRLTNGVKNLKDVINAHRQADEKRNETKPIAVAELSTQVPIRVQTETKRTKAESVWRVLKSALETIGIIAVVSYTIVAYHQWQTMRDANYVSMGSFRRARIDSNSQVKEGRRVLAIDQRAWIGIINTNTPDTVAPMNQFELSSDVKNFGHTPANHVAVTTAMKILCGPFPRAPPYGITPKLFAERTQDTIFPGQDPIGTGAQLNHPLTMKEFVSIAVKDKSGDYPCSLYYYSNVEYCDVFGAKHFLHKCTRWRPANGGMSGCNTYNDGDEDYPDRPPATCTQQ